MRVYRRDEQPSDFILGRLLHRQVPFLGLGVRTAHAKHVMGRCRTEFEIGLELDSAEVRGILLYEGQEWGRVVFDFRS